ncbi:MAG: hypothetical protein LBD85_07080, partial [Oscillospiraceae bacterium]|nr:hypothetical protein [Oscillospiraceae bacterium]
MKHKKKVNSVADTAVELNDHQQGDVETSVLENALALITREFGLSSKEYIVSAFADKADRVAVTVC